MRITALGDLLVGKSSGPNYNVVGADITHLGEGQFTVNNGEVLQLNRKSSDGTIVNFRKDGTTVGSIGSCNSSSVTYLAGSASGGGIGVANNSAAVFPARPAGVIDNTINLGSGFYRFKDLYLSGTAYAGILNLKDANTNGQITCLTPTGGRLYTNTYAEQISQIQGSEKMRLDSSGNLLVGTTSGSRKLEVHADNVPPMRVRRNTSDGNLVEYYKDGSNVGSIGVDYSDNLYITGNSSHAGFMFANDEVYPYRDGNYRDATLSLGAPSGRWKDLYLSGGVYLGGTGAANKLDDYEEGTFTPSLTFAGQNTGMVLGSVHGTYTKVGRMVTSNIRGTISTLGSSAGQLYLEGLPFTVGDTLPSTGLEAVGHVGFVSKVQVTTTNLNLIPSAGGTFARFPYTSSSYETEYLGSSNISNGFDFRATLTYFTA